MSSEPRDAPTEPPDEPRADRGAGEDDRLVALRTERIWEVGAANPVEATPDSPPPPLPPLDPLELDPEALNGEDDEADEELDEDDEDPEEDDDPLPPEEPPDDPRPPMPRIPSPVKPPKLRLPLMGGAMMETYLSATVDPVRRITRLTPPRETVRVRNAGPAVPPPPPVVSV
jgi:hypothetical protein